MPRQPVMDASELQAFIHDIFPQQRGRFRIESVEPLNVRMRWLVGESDLRPGGTVSGPTMFALADCCFYAATLSMIGRESLTVTTNLNINFLRKPPAADLWAEARILKLGRTLATGDVTLYSVDVEDPVAHAAVTYAIPPARSGGA